jgi:excisionase family DNA binding protein
LTETIDPKDLILVKEIAEELDVHIATLLRAIGAKKLKAIKIGRSYRTTKKWLQEYMEREATEVEVR